MGKLWSDEYESRGLSLVEPRVFDTPTPGPLGDELKTMFDQICDGPMPKRLLDLADALEAAFQRGELHAEPCAKALRSR